MLKLYIPKLEDLWFREQLMSDKETMSYNEAWGGTIPFPKQKLESWYNYYIINNENKRFYSYLLDGNINEYVGEVSYHYDDNLKVFICGIIILSKYRSKGYGTEGLNLLCDVALKNGIATLYDNIGKNNNSINLFIKNGFIIEYETNEFIMVKKNL